MVIESSLSYILGSEANHVDLHEHYFAHNGTKYREGSILLPLPGFLQIRYEDVHQTPIGR